MSCRRGLGTTVDDLAQAIARFEGFLVSGSIAQRDNNPGNLRSGPGQVGTDSGGYAIFPDVATGYAALDNQIQLNVNRGLTLNQFFAGEPGVYAGYAPSADSNNPAQYASTVAGWLAIDPNTPLTQVLEDSTPSASLSPISGSTDTLNSAITGDSSPASDLFDQLDLSGATGLSAGALAAVLVGIIVLAFAFRR
jgi:hypothetical protein